MDDRPAGLPAEQNPAYRPARSPHLSGTCSERRFRRSEAIRSAGPTSCR